MAFFASSARRHRHVFCEIFLTLLFVLVHPDCPPIKEGDNAVITCTLTKLDACNEDDSGDLLTWVFLGKKEVVNLQCDKHQCREKYISRYYDFSGDINVNGSTLMSTVTVHPSNYLYQEYLMGTWTCDSQTDCYQSVRACENIEVYALPVGNGCQFSEDVNMEGDFLFVTVACSTTKVYPEARCKFYDIKDGSTGREILYPVSIKSTDLGGYYQSWCETNVPVTEFVEGTHRFEARIFPNVTGGDNLEGVENTPASGEDIVLTLPITSINCSAENKDGFYKGRETVCWCSLISEGHPRGKLQWYKDDQEIQQDIDGSVTLVHDSSNPDAAYFCKGMSVIGVKDAESTTVKFAFLDAGSIEIGVSQPTSYRYEENIQRTSIIVTCRVEAYKAYPGVYFSASQDGLTIHQQDEATVSEGYYQTQFIFDLDQNEAEIHEVSCRAKNSVFLTIEDVKSTTYQVSDESLAIFQQSKPTTSSSEDCDNAVVVVLVVILCILAVCLGVIAFLFVRKLRSEKNKSDKADIGQALTDVSDTQTSSVTTAAEASQAQDEVKPSGNPYEELREHSQYANQASINLGRLSSSETDEVNATYDVPCHHEQDTEHQHQDSKHPKRRDDYVEMKRPDGAYNN